MPILQLGVYNQTTQPIYVGQPFQVNVGFYDDTGALHNVNNDAGYLLSWVVLDGTGLVMWYEPGQIKALTPGSYRICFTYRFGDSEYTSYYSFCAVVPEPSGLTQLQAYACLKREEPAGVYSQSDDPLTSLTYNDNWAFSKLIEDLYVHLNQQTNNLFPEDLAVPSDGNVQQWEYMLTGTYNLFNPNSSRTPDILQFIRNAGFSFNPYDLAYWVSQYIWLKLSKNTYVYIQESLIPYNKNYWILNESKLGVNTYLGPGGNLFNRLKVIIHVLNYSYVIDDRTKSEILFLLKIWGMCGITYEIDYGRHPSDFGLTQDLQDTYKGDPRTIGVYCLQYNTNAVRQVYGLSNPYAPSKLLSIQIIPASGTFYVSNNIHFIVQGVYELGYTRDITNECKFLTSTPDTLQQMSLQNVFTCIDPGLGQVTATYWFYSVTSNITIEPFVTTNWILNVSQLGTDTILG